MILLNDFRRQWEDVREDCHRALERTGASGWYILGREVREFERRLAALWGLREAVGVASGLDALEAGLRALGLRPGEKVLTAPVSAFATALAVVRAGGVPVFAPCGADGLADPGACEELLARDASIRFFVPVHLYGHCLDMDALARIARRGVRIVEDCAQSILARWRGRGCGTAGAAAAVSFYPTKNLGAMGDGGALLTNDEEVAAKARQWRDYGQRSKYEHVTAGANSRLDELHAALLLEAGLPRLERWTARRREIARRYREGIRHPQIELPAPPQGSEPVWHLFPVLVPDGAKAAFRQHLERSGVQTGEHYPVPLFDQPAMRHLPHEIAGDPGVARAFCRREASLPIHPYLSDSEVEAVIEACNGWPGA
ncbi:MAG: DegT/DnrJ/EryC1/StrS family aminotransferase [Bryobacteraceae bacterium]|nr:DegT/DnrJ/EryC1/StrS family aminotransferase [Bryobacteraceae bacterium]